jgi:hypothetical protein
VLVALLPLLTLFLDAKTHAAAPFLRKILHQTLAVASVLFRKNLAFVIPSEAKACPE